MKEKTLFFEFFCCGIFFSIMLLAARVDNAHILMREVVCRSFVFFNDVLEPFCGMISI